MYNIQMRRTIQDLYDLAKGFLITIMVYTLAVPPINTAWYAGSPLIPAKVNCLRRHSLSMTSRVYVTPLAT